MSKLSEQEMKLAAKLINEHRGIIFKICRNWCSVEQEREDLAQEIIYQILRSFHRFDSNFKFSTWMYRVALNVAISDHRKNMKVQSAPLKPEHETAPANDDELAVQREHELTLLQQFIQELNEMDRALMVLYLETKSYSEIGDIMGISESNVGTRIGRIKEKLRNKFLKIKY